LPTRKAKRGRFGCITVPRPDCRRLLPGQPSRIRHQQCLDRRQPAVTLMVMDTRMLSSGPTTTITVRQTKGGFTFITGHLVDWEPLLQGPLSQIWQPTCLDAVWRVEMSMATGSVMQSSGPATPLSGDTAMCTTVLRLDLCRQPRGASHLRIPEAPGRMP
jgi:hypothetical protein